MRSTPRPITNKRYRQAGCFLDPAHRDGVRRTTTATRARTRAKLKALEHRGARRAARQTTEVS